MAQGRIRKIVIAGVMGAISALLGWTHWGFIPWVTGAALTIMHVPVIIGAVLEGPIVGTAIGLIFGLFSMLQAAVAPTGPSDVLFTNPLIAVVPRLFIGVVAWLVWRILQKNFLGNLIGGVILAAAAHALLVAGGIRAWSAPILYAIGAVGIVFDLLLLLYGLGKPQATALVAAGIAGSLTNTVLVLGMIGLIGAAPWAALPPILLANGLPEAGVSAVITLVVVAAWRRIEIGERKGADL